MKENSSKIEYTLDLRMFKHGNALKQVLFNKVFTFLAGLIARTTAVFLILNMVFFNFYALIGAWAYYNDIEQNGESLFQTAILDFSLDSEADFSPAITPTTTAERVIAVSNNGNLEIEYKLDVNNFSGDSEFCQNLEIEAYLNNNFIASGTLTGFNLNNIHLNAGQDDNFTFKAFLPFYDPVWQNKFCDFDFVFDGKQTEGPGFFDIEIISNTIQSGRWGTGENNKILITKVYYEPDSEHGQDLDNEWIELYNPGAFPIDISGWNLKDNTFNKIIPSVDLIQPMAYALISASSTTWQYWDIPSETLKIDFGKLIGDGLDNDGDRVILKDPSGNIIDAVSYGNDNFAFDPPCPDIDQGHLLGRVPVDLDTDKADDWQDLALPEIAVTYPNGGEEWWVGRTYRITWTANNPNGDNADLAIDLYYSADSGRTWGQIASSTANNGFYDWRVSLFLEGNYYVPSPTARIKVAARGPENFMVYAWDSSDQDFCPPIDYSLITPEELEALIAMGLFEYSDASSTASSELLELSTEQATQGESSASSNENESPSGSASVSGDSEQEDFAPDGQPKSATSSNNVLASSTPPIASSSNNILDNSASSSDQTFVNDFSNNISDIASSAPKTEQTKIEEEFQESGNVVSEDETKEEEDCLEQKIGTSINYSAPEAEPNSDEQPEKTEESNNETEAGSKNLLELKSEESPEQQDNSETEVKF